MSALAAQTGAINLGQGFPDEDAPAAVLEAARAAIAHGVNQYPPGRGIPDLLLAIAEHQQRFYRQQRAWSPCRCTGPTSNPTSMSSAPRYRTARA
jgi:aspartate/methionine/tyrosine aminotransferase